MNEVSLTRFKRCTKCKCWKSATPQFFRIDSRANSGISAICRVCRTAATRAYRKANPELITRQQKENYERNREVILARCRAYNKENWEARRQYARRYREKNLEALREQERLYYWNNKDKTRESERRRRARIRNAERVPYSEADLNQLWHDQEGCCFYCGMPVFADYHIEHMVPLSRGGPDKLENICLSCPVCNWSKGTKTAEEFVELLGGRE